MTAAQTPLDRHAVPVEVDLSLPKPPGVIRRFWSRHPRLTDVLVAAAFTVPAVSASLLIAAVPDSVRNPELAPLGAAVYAVGGAALLWRRRRPWAVLVVAWAISLVGVPVWDSVDVTLMAFALYALAVYGSVRAAWIGLAGSALVTATGSGVIAAIAIESNVPVTAANFSQIGALLIVVLVGINIANRRRYVVALLDRAAQLARERDQTARLAAADERARIAREMHDIVSHGLTVMVTLAEGSAATTAADPERAAVAMRQVAGTGRQALTDMRRMLGLLDDGLPGELGPQPGLEDLAALVERFRAAGLRVTVSAEGIPPADPAEQLTVYRIVQESLTNVLRHSASGADVTVDVRYGPAGVVITVTNDGPVVAAPLPGSGRGTVGMRERVALYGGTVESGPRPGGGWTVRATLAHEPAPADTTPDENETAR
jgi:signal transduction histidine kinase